MRYFIFLFCFFWVMNGYGEELKELLENPAFFDGKKVTVSGEVIGEILSTPQGFWINILDDQALNIGIFTATLGELKAITHFGSYQEKGDQVKVEGIFYSSCPDHLERDIHAEYISVIEPGRVLPEHVPAEKKQTVIILAGICLLLAIVNSVRSYYGRKNTAD